MTSQSDPVLAADTPPRPTVRITLAGASASTTWLVTSRLARTWSKLEATVITNVIPKLFIGDVLAPGTAGDQARVWIDLSDPHAANVFVVEGGHVFQRTIAFVSGFDDVALELLDVVTTSAVQAVLAGEHLGITREEFKQSQDAATSAAPTRTAPAPTRAATALVGVSYEGTMLASDVITHGLGLEAQVQWKKLRFGFELRGRFPERVAGDALSVAPEGLRLSVGRELALGAGWSCVLSLAGGIDVTRVRSTSVDSNVSNRAPFWSLTPVLSPGVRAEYVIGKVRAAALLGMDVDLRSTSYVVSTSQAPLPLWTPWRLRPVAGATLSHEL